MLMRLGNLDRNAIGSCLFLLVKKRQKPEEADAAYQNSTFFYKLGE